MGKAGHGEDSEGQQSGCQTWIRANVKESYHEEWKNIFQVIQMSSSDAFDIVVWFHFTILRIGECLLGEKWSIMELNLDLSLSKLYLFQEAHSTGEWCHD